METVHQKAEELQNMSIKAMNLFFPEKEVCFTNDDQPWMDSRIKLEIRKKKKNLFQTQKKFGLGKSK